MERNSFFGEFLLSCNMKRRAGFFLIDHTFYLCYHVYNKRVGDNMYIQIDFNSEEAFYIQLRNQIIIGIATNQYREGDTLPSVRQLAETVGINMHTVNKAYAVLKQEGFIRLDRRRGAVIALDANRLRAMEELAANLQVVLARAVCKGVTEEEVHQMVTEIFRGMR